MILWDGREAYYRGIKVIILEKVNTKLVKVAKASNPRMILYVCRSELEPVWLNDLLYWRMTHI